MLVGGALTGIALALPLIISAIRSMQSAAKTGAAMSKDEMPIKLLYVGIVGAVIVLGELNGTIDAKERIEVYPPGRLGGDVLAAVISIKPGGIFNGNCAMKVQTTPSKKAPAPSKNSSVPTGSQGE